MALELDIIAIGCLAMDYYLILEGHSWKDEKIKAQSAQLLPGGTMGNFATAAAKLGAKTGFIGVVGKDPWGDHLINDFKALGIDTSRIITRSDGLTPLTILLLDDEGKRINILPPFPLLQRDEIDLDYLSKARLIHTHLFDSEVVKLLFEEAKKRRITTSIDLELHRIKQIPSEELKDTIGLCDLVFLNRDTFDWITSTMGIELTVNSLREWGPKIFVVTLGKEGSLVVTPKEAFRKASFEVKGVDPTGAGDAYAGAFCFGWLKGWPLRKTIEFASATAALSVTKMGARAGLPTLQEVLSFLEKSNFSEI